MAKIKQKNITYGMELQKKLNKEYGWNHNMGMNNMTNNTRFQDNNGSYEEEYEGDDESLMVNYPEDFGHDIEADGDPIILPCIVRGIPAEYMEHSRENSPINGNGYLLEEMSVEDQMSFWLSNISFKRFSDEISARVIGQKNLRKVLLSVYLYIVNTAKGRDVRNNILLAAPSGCGKTETYRALKQYFQTYIPKLVICQIDMSSITEEGYKGEDTNCIVAPLRAGESNGIGIVFLDEFDKKLIPSLRSDGTNMNQAVQSQILTLIEGREIEGIDTNKTMFVGMGAFDQCRKERKKHREIGFMTSNPNRVRQTEHYGEITIKDAMELGAIPELIGRFTTLINYEKLSKRAIDRIIDITAAEIGCMFNMDVKIEKSFRKYLHSQANTEFGCRLIYNKIYDKMLTAVDRLVMNDTPFEKTSISLRHVEPKTVENREKRVALN